MLIRYLGMNCWREEMSVYPDVSEMRTVPVYTVSPGSLCDVCCDGDDD